MLPHVAAWSWDLRPLQLGLPAVPVAPSGVDGVAPVGDVCLGAVQAVLDAGAFSDKAILTDVLHGVSDDVRAPRGSLLCAPHTGARGLRSGGRRLPDAARARQVGLSRKTAPLHQTEPSGDAELDRPSRTCCSVAWANSDRLMGLQAPSILRHEMMHPTTLSTRAYSQYTQR